MPQERIAPTFDKNAYGHGFIAEDGVINFDLPSSIDAAGWKVSVHNWGRPIPPEVQTSLFQPMVRGVAEGSANRSVGLGLYIVSEIAKAHCGTLAVRSTQEAGTTFEFGAPHPPA